MSKALVAPFQVRGAGWLKQRRPLAIFASSGDDERRRRPADVFALWTGLVILLACAIERENPTPTFYDLTQFLQTLPDWSQTLIGGVMALGSVCVVLVFLLAVVAADRRGLVRDLLVGAVLTVVAVGMPQADALAAAIIYRACTFYLRRSGATSHSGG